MTSTLDRDLRSKLTLSASSDELSNSADDQQPMPQQFERNYSKRHTQMTKSCTMQRIPGSREKRSEKKYSLRQKSLENLLSLRSISITGKKKGSDG